MNKQWRIKDLIDLEYFLHGDETQSDESENQKDRKIFLNHIQPLLQKEKSPLPASRSTIIRHWLDERRNLERKDLGPKAKFPGDAFDEGYKFSVFILIIIGLLSGAGLAVSFLTAYKGTEALNVFGYVGGLVLMQIFLLFALGFFSFLRRRNRLFKSVSIVYPLLSAFLAKTLFKLTEGTMNKLSAERRNHLKAAIGLVRGKQILYGSIFFWPIFLIAQIFGIALNIGILAATILRVLISDLAFGWQSTVQFSSQAVYQLVKAISLPWSWMISPPIAYPTLEQIHGTRMVLKEGISPLATQDLVSWWPFLCLAVIFYGLLPRLILFFVALIAKKRAIRKLDFGHAACDRLMMRLKTPSVSTSRGEHEKQPPEPFVHHIPKAVILKPEQNTAVLEDKVIALIPDDIFEQCREEEFKHKIQKTFGFDLRKKMKIGIDIEKDKKMLADLAAAQLKNGHPKVLMLQEAWQPPIQETLSFIREIRETVEQKTIIAIALIGKPASNTIFTEVKDNDWKVWHQEIEKISDPYIRIERLVGNDR